MMRLKSSWSRSIKDRAADPQTSPPSASMSSILPAREWPQSSMAQWERLTISSLRKGHRSFARLEKLLMRPASKMS